MTKISEFFDLVLGQGEGYLAVSYGQKPNTPTFYAWPHDKRKLLADVKSRRDTENVFFCPVLRQTTAVSYRGGLTEEDSPPIERIPCLYADVDLVDGNGKPRKVNHTLLADLPFLKVATGHKGHKHVYLPLSEAVDPHTHRELNTALKNALGADHKQSHVAWLRVPGSINHKPDLDKPCVRLLRSQPEAMSPDALRAILQSSAASTRTPRMTGAQRASQTSVPPSVRRVMREWRNVEEGKRNEAVFAIVSEARKQSLSAEATTDLVRNHPAGDRFKTARDLERDVRRIWHKVDTEPTPSLPTRRTSWELDDLMDEEFPDLKWVIPGLIPEGLTLLVAAPKVGKSMLVANISLMLTHGMKVLGDAETEPCEVLIIPLDDPSPRRMKERFSEILKTIPPGTTKKYKLHIELDWPTLAEGGGELLDAWLDEHPNCRVVIIDTLSRLRDEETRKATDPGKPDEKAMAEFKAIADNHQVGIIGTHHDRKSQADDFIDAVSGNKKLTGGADTIIYLKRRRNSQTATAHITGRDLPEQEINLEFEYPLWSIVDPDPESDLSDLRRAIVHYLRDHGEGTISDIAAALGKTYNTVNQRMLQMKRDGEVHQPNGKRTPYSLTRARAYATSKMHNNDNDVMTDSEPDSLRRYHYYDVSRHQARTRSRESEHSALREATKRRLNFGSID